MIRPRGHSYPGFRFTKQNGSRRESFVIRNWEDIFHERVSGLPGDFVARREPDAGLRVLGRSPSGTAGLAPWGLTCGQGRQCKESAASGFASSPSTSRLAPRADTTLESGGGPSVIHREPLRSVFEGQAVFGDGTDSGERERRSGRERWEASGGQGTGPSGAVFGSGEAHQEGRGAEAEFRVTRRAARPIYWFCGPADHRADPGTPLPGRIDEASLALEAPLRIWTGRVDDHAPRCPRRRRAPVMTSPFQLRGSCFRWRCRRS